MKVFVHGQGAVDLRDADFLTEGGEGKIYVKGQTVYKIYHNQDKVIPHSKFQELSVLDQNNILKPEHLVLDKNHKPIGYCMKHVADTHQLPRLFTKAFRQREGVTDQMIFNLVKRMEETVSHIHKKGILLVDLNELNFLIAKQFNEIYFVDVDSYQTKSFPATAIMETVRDRHAGLNFSEGTDWFSFAIVTFQMFIGIHPYKGTYQGMSLDDRMKQNISVLHSGVSLPKVCYPFTALPQDYHKWYIDVFEKGERRAPLTVGGFTPVVKLVKTIKSTNRLEIVLLYKDDSQNRLLDVYHNAGKEVLVFPDRTLVNRREIKVHPGVIGFTPQNNYPVSAWIEHGMVKLYDLYLNQEILFPCFGSAVMSYDGRIYIKNSVNILEVQFLELGKSYNVAAKPVVSIMERATQFFDGVVIQNLLGAYYAGMFPQGGNHLQVRLPELDPDRVIDAKYSYGVLMVVTIDKNGLYHRHIYRFSGYEYDYRKVENIVYSGLNFTVLPSGICASITEDEKLELFSATKDSKRMTVVEDPDIDFDMRLYNNGTKVIFARGGELYQMSMR